ncbi:Ku protein, partial [Streptomyces oryzae]
MARPVWSGVITFGLVTVPVRMYAATEDHTTHFRQLQRGTNDRVRNKRVNERTGKGVEYDDIVKGYEVADGEYVTVEREELAEIAPGKSQVIDVSGFVDADQIDPVHYARAYYLFPSGDQYGKPYELLRAALAESGMTGIATFVMHNRECLVALRGGDEALTLHTLHWSDEVRDPREELPVLPRHEQAGGKELKTARQLIESMSTPFRPQDSTDTYEDRVRALVEAKAKGEEIAPEEGPPEATNVVDLTEALNRSIERARSGKRDGKKGRQQGTAKGKGQRKGAGAGRAESSPRKSRGLAELSELSKDELYQRASAQGIKGRSKMSREQ